MLSSAIHFMGVWIKRQIADKSDRLIVLLKETGKNVT